MRQSSHAREVRRIGSVRLSWPLETSLFTSALVVMGLCCCVSLKAQQDVPDWVGMVRRSAELHDWAAAMQVINQEGSRRPDDVEVREWRAREGIPEH